MYVALTIAALLLAPLVALCVGITVMDVRFALWHRWHGVTLRPASPGERLAVIANEVAAWVVLGLWAVRGRLGRPRDPGAMPVVCVHGFTQNATNFRGIRLALEAQGRPTTAISLGIPPKSIERYAARVIARLEALVERYDQPIDLIAHSMGGIVLRQALAERPDLGARVRNIITLGTPHAGTEASRWLPGPGTWEYRQMRRGSHYLLGLPDFQVTAPEAQVTTVAAERDLIVFPTRVAHLAGARQVNLVGLGHAGLLTRDCATQAVLAALAPEVQRISERSRYNRRPVRAST